MYWPYSELESQRSAKDEIGENKESKLVSIKNWSIDINKLEANYLEP